MHPALIDGDLRFITDDEQVLAFERILPEDKNFVAINLSGEPAELRVTTDMKALDGNGLLGSVKNGLITLPPWRAFFGWVGQRSNQIVL